MIMKRSSLLLLNVLVIIYGALPAIAQRGGPSGNRLPAVGSQLPDLKAFDEFGNEFSTSSLRGSYSVLVFGCLT